MTEEEWLARRDAERDRERAEKIAAARWNRIRPVDAFRELLEGQCLHRQLAAVGGSDSIQCAVCGAVWAVT